MQTTLVCRRRPSKSELKEHEGAEIVFEREDNHNKRIHTIFASKCYESWEQWGAIREILSENVEEVELWRREQDEI